MPRYLDPKTDIVFKKIFGEHPELLKSFLNSILPLPEKGLIDRLEYLPSEQVPTIPAFKYTVVDVKCTDEQGRVFIVEMQIQWTDSFKQRLLFNVSKAYIRQLEKGEDYELLRPVYGLGLINTTFDPDEEHWYHHYKIVNVQKPVVEIKDLQLVFIELPKFKAKNYPEKKLKVLWLRFLSELNEKVNQAPSDWLEEPEIKLALDLAEEAAYTPAELEDYDRYWDAISIEKTLVNAAHRSGMAQGEVIGLEKGIVIGQEKGREEGSFQTQQALVHKLQAKGLTLEEIAGLMDLSLNEIRNLSGDKLS